MERSYQTTSDIAYAQFAGLFGCSFRREFESTYRIKRLSQLLEETEHFRRWRQKEVAKIVQCGDHNARRRELEDRFKIYKGHPILALTLGYQLIALKQSLERGSKGIPEVYSRVKSGD